MEAVMRSSPAIFSALVLALGAVAYSPTVLAADSQQAVWYTQQAKLYGIAVPPGANIEEVAPNAAVIRSQHGYVLRMQHAPLSDLSLPEMAAKLESLYLGTGKTWASKLSEKNATIGGLPALEAVYDGSNIRSKAIIARGAKTDFVLIFSAPGDAYTTRIRDFDWMLDNFRPAAGEMTVAAATPEPTAPAPAATASVATAEPKAESPKAIKAAAPLATLPEDVAQFSEKDIGYTVAFPGDWVATRLNPAAVLLSGREGSDAYYSTVGIQNIQPPKAGGPQEAMAIVIAGLKSELSEKAKEVRYFDEGPMFYEKKDLTLKAHQFVVTYIDGGQRYKQWTMVLPRPSGTVIHVWSYRSPENQFDIYRPIADAIRQSWRIDVPQPQTALKQ